MGARVSGAAGAVVYGYAEAARLGPWALETREDGTAALAADVQEMDEAWAAQRPLTVVLRIGTAEWVWHGLDPAFGGRRMTVALHGRPDVSRPLVGA